MATIFDAVDVAAIPAHAQVVLAYIDGQYQTYSAVRAKYPSARILTVTTTGKSRAHICDVESGDADPTGARQWARNGLYLLPRPCNYSQWSLKAPLDATMAGIPWDWFSANPGTLRHVDAGAVATQYAWPGAGSPGNYDISIALDSWLGGPPLPVPPAPPPIQQEALDMFFTDPVTGLLVAADAKGDIFARDGAIPHIVTLVQHPEWGAGNFLNPCVGLVSEKDPNGTTWGYTFITAPVTGKGGFGPYSTFHVNRDGSS